MRHTSIPPTSGLMTRRPRCPTVAQPSPPPHCTVRRFSPRTSILTGAGPFLPESRAPRGPASGAFACSHRILHGIEFRELRSSVSTTSPSTSAALVRPTALVGFRARVRYSGSCREGMRTVGNIRSRGSLRAAPPGGSAPRLRAMPAASPSNRSTRASPETPSAPAVAVR